MRYLTIAIAILLTSCYSAPEVEGFERDVWDSALTDCSDYRYEFVSDFVQRDDNAVITSNQNEVKALFGNPTRHRLFNRNQKFFYYQLNCDNTHEMAVRFDALGRVKEITLEETSEE
jgi:hypothetical protein